MRRLLGYYLVALGFCVWFGAWALLPKANQLVFRDKPDLEFYFSLLNMVLFLALLPVIQLPLRLGAALVCRRASEVAASDPRAVVLLLRSFADDHQQVRTMSPITRFLFFRYFIWHYTTLEQMLVRVFSPFGPVVAIGRPGELLPPLGAAREWLPDAAWKQHVEELLQRCRLVVMIVGDLPYPGTVTGLAWEIEKLAECGAINKTVFILPPLPDRDVRMRWELLSQLSRRKLPDFQGGELGVMFSPSGRPIALRGLGRRWEADYLHALLPQVAGWRTNRPRCAAESVYNALKWIFPLGRRDLASESLAHVWLGLLFALAAYVALSLMAQGDLLAGCWVALCLGALGWTVATIEEVKLYYGDGGWAAAGFVRPSTPKHSHLPPPEPEQVADIREAPRPSLPSPPEPEAVGDHETPQALAGRLVALFPDFEAAWNSPDNYFRDDDGSFTHGGVFSAFSPFFRDGYRRFTPHQLLTLGRLVEDCLSSPARKLRDAVVRDFLENVAPEPCGPDFRQYLGDLAVRHYKSPPGRRGFRAQ
jgi:hypothetical protein